jgi:hypothetical protein
MAKTIKKEALKEENKTEATSVMGDITEPGYYAFQLNSGNGKTYFADSTGMIDGTKDPLPDQVPTGYPIRTMKVVVEAGTSQVLYPDEHGFLDATNLFPVPPSDKYNGFYVKEYKGSYGRAYANALGILQEVPLPPDPDDNKE